PDPAVRGAALALAGRFRLREALPVALRALEGKENEPRKAALEAIVSLYEPSLKEKLLACRSAEALLAAGRLRLQAAIPLAREALMDRDPDRRCAAVETLRRLDAHQAADDLLPRLEDDSPAVREAAARVLPHLAGQSAGAALHARLKKEKDAR